MTNRVLLQGGQASAFKVSLPGYDVSTSELDGIAFDSRFNGFSVFMRGSGTMGAEGWVPVYFPQVLPRPPIAFVQWDLQTGTGAPFWCSPFFYNGDGILNYLRATVYTDQIQLIQRFNFWTPTGNLKALNYRFILFRNPAA